MMPASWNLTKASVTALAQRSSIVNRSRDQSTLLPSLLSCVQMRLPYWPFQAQTCSRNFSLPKSCLETGGDCLASIFSTTDCVAIPAWSVPGTYKVASPRMRCHRVRQSSIAAVRACPKCKEPVTFGGGITITNFSSAGLDKAFFSSQPYQPDFSYQSCQAASTSPGL